jgi:hypothetical protein
VQKCQSLETGFGKDITPLNYWYYSAKNGFQEAMLGDAYIFSSTVIKYLSTM